MNHKEAFKLSVIELYRNWVRAWNQKSAEAMAELLAERCVMIGFDGSKMDGREDVLKTLSDIFSAYPTGRFVVVIKDVQFLSESVAILTAYAGMVPRGYHEINPAVNAHQTMVATLSDSIWDIVHFQNTPAAFHGRPELVKAMSDELTAELKRNPFSED